MTTMIYKNVAQCTLWKNEKFTITEKIFRQINYLVTSLVSVLISRNFHQKSELLLRNHSRKTENGLARNSSRKMSHEKFTKKCGKNRQKNDPKMTEIDP